jgi:hypothetical protein
MKPGDQVTVTAAGTASTPAQIIDIRNVQALLTIDELAMIALHKGIPPPPTSIDFAQVRGILLDMGVRRVALITYDLLDQAVVFAALDFGRGEWRDLKGTTITIEPAEEACTSDQPSQSQEPAQ